MSPLDWDLIETWKDSEIPLHVVIRAIEDVFDAYDKKPTKRRAIKSLTYCKDEVEAQHEEWLDAQIGKSNSSEKSLDNSFGESKTETFAENDISAHIERILLELAAAKVKFDGDTVSRIEKAENGLKSIDIKSLNAEKIEEQLEAFDKDLDELLLDSEHSEDLKVKLSKKMAEYKPKMDAEAYNRTFNLMLLKQLREETGIPRCSLFYL